MSVKYNKSPSASRGVKVGDRAPDFTLPSLTGEPVSLESFLDKKNIVIIKIIKEFLDRIKHQTYTVHHEQLI